MFTLNCNGRILAVNKPLVMGILNMTPDSFFPGSRVDSGDGLLRMAEKMIGEGADMLDIGGQSTRPGSTPVDEEEELRRVINGIISVHKRFPEAVISIDTYYSRVAQEAVGAGAGIVNDISAGRLDPSMVQVVADLRVPYVLMHMQGVPGTMQQTPVYEDVTREVLDFFIHRVEALRKAGIHDIILDPGFGFGKTIRHNLDLLRNLSVFSMLELPIMAGLSRKSTITQILGIPAAEALNGTSVLNTIALLNGASLLRVHDVKEAREVISLVSACYEKR